MVQQQTNNIDSKEGIIRSRTVPRSPTPENMHYVGGDAGFGSNGNGQALQHQQCCSSCGDGSPTASFHHQQHPSGPLFSSHPSCGGCSPSSGATGTAITTANIGPASSEINGTPSSGSIPPTAVKCEVGRVEVCEGCGLTIADRYVMRVADGSWHEDCLVCCVCHAPLVHSCFTRSGRVYCRQDYDRVYGAKCGRCNERLYPHELVMRAGTSGLAFHLPCFGCFVCGRPLQKGDQFVVRAGQLLCRADLEKDQFFLLQNSTNNNNNVDLLGEDSAADDSNRPRHDGRRGPKRPRTILTSAQRRQFKASFEISPKPCRKVREALAKETGLSVRVVQVWFQNQRAKMKKLQRKAKIEADKSGGSASGSQSSNNPNSNDKGKDSKGDGHKKRFGDGDSRGGNSSIMPYSPNGGGSYRSGDSMCGSDLSLDGDSAGFDQMDDGQSINGVDLHDMHHQSHQQPHQMSLHHMDVASPPHPLHHSELIGQHHHLHQPYHPVNPIDKLYLMQNAYFHLDQ